MSWILALITKLLGSSLLEKIADILQKRADTEVAKRTSDNATGAQVASAIISAEIETNKAKAATHLWWGAKLIVVMAGFPAAAHMGAVFLDSMFQFSWNVTRLPSPYDGYQRDIVLSFFILAPTMKVADALSVWLRR